MAGVGTSLEYIDTNLEAARARLFELLRIPSISAQPDHAADCQRAAEWLRGQFEGLGFQASVRPTAGHPVVIAYHPGPGGAAPHLLYYGHYDVQPPEPLDLWTSPPFVPVLADGPHGKRVVARGAVDDKGQVLTWLEAFRAWQEAGGSLPVQVTVLVEGEEEVGSPSLAPFLTANRGELRADAMVVSDTGMWDINTPAITTRLRGSTYVEIGLQIAARDLHSGLFGGSAQNAANVLARVLGSLHDDGGRVQLPGFYDGIRPLPPGQVEAWEELGFDEAAFLGRMGLRTPAGERGRPALERLWARPTADITGIWSGYTGAGAKTVIPAEAHAKVSFRLVPGQDPAAVVESLRRFVGERLPPEAEVRYDVMFQGRGLAIPADSRWVRAASAALEAEFGRPPVLMGSGGSIPVVEMVKEVLGLDALLVGFGLNDDQVHSPNEKFELTCFHKGQRTHVRLLTELAR
ncbi:MAG: M20/M25/M40 family metallo-hydrolase [Acetobacteraceae bacterium]|nr:M20/M25/M40 family metallo-hydrolase [Acetobacteraceae bacterium]